MKVTQKEFLNYIWLMFVIIPFFKPDIVVSFPKLNLIFTAWQILGFIYFCVIYFRRGKVSKFVLLFLLYYFVLLMSTILNKGDIEKWITNFTLYLGSIMLIEIYIKKDYIKILKILVIVFYILTIGNTFSFIIFPEGLSQTEYLKTPIYMLGIDNRFAFTYIPALCIIGIYDLIKNQKITKVTFIYFFITFGTLLYFWSAGALLVESLFIIYYICIYKFHIKIQPRLYFIVAIGGFISLVFFRIQNLFDFLIVDILHKDLTLSSRTLIWDKALKIINQNKFIGIGIQESNIMTNLLTAFHSHCDFLNILLQSGICGLAIYWVILYKAFGNLSKYKHNDIAQLVAFSIGVLLIMLLVDTFDITANLFILICIAYNIKYLIERNMKDG